MLLDLLYKLDGEDTQSPTRRISMPKSGRNSRSPVKQLRQIDSESSSSISAKSKVTEVKEDFYATK